MEIIKKPEKKDPHPYISELKELFNKGRISRRDFLRKATLLGLSSVAAYSFVFPFSAQKAKAATMPKRGGIWKCNMPLQPIDHPARLSNWEGANIVRQVAEYLTETGPDNITRPWLAEKWTASEDLKDKDALTDSLAVGFRLVKKVEREFGTTNCVEIQTEKLGRSYRLTDPKEYEKFIQAKDYVQCPQVVGKIARMTAEFILDYQSKKAKG